MSTINIPPAASYPLLATLRIRPASLQDINAILVLHSEAFADKFGSAFGSNGTNRGIIALSTAWQRQGERALRGMFLAELHEEIVGTSTLRTWETRCEDNATTELAFHQVLGLWGAIRSTFALSLLNHTIDRNEGFVTDVAVHSCCRRRGIASGLLRHIEQEAQQQRKRFLGLYVSSNNTGARALYQRLGFYNVRIRSSWLTRLIFGQGKWVYMRKDII